MELASRWNVLSPEGMGKDPNFWSEFFLETDGKILEVVVGRPGSRDQVRLPIVDKNPFVGIRALRAFGYIQPAASMGEDKVFQVLAKCLLSAQSEMPGKYRSTLPLSDRQWRTAFWGRYTDDQLVMVLRISKQLNFNAHFWLVEFCAERVVREIFNRAILRVCAQS